MVENTTNTIAKVGVGYGCGVDVELTYVNGKVSQCLLSIEVNGETSGTVKATANIDSFEHNVLDRIIAALVEARAEFGKRGFKIVE